MKRVFSLLLFIVTINVSLGQIYEVGFFLGGTNYIGDIGSEYYINPNRVGGGFVFKYNINPRIALRGNFSYFPLFDDDANATSSFRRERDFKFIETNNVFELAAGVEINFFDYQNATKDNLQHTPYILAQIAVFNYKSVDNLVVSSTSENFFGSNFANNYSYTLPVGLGYKGRLGRNVAYAIESGVRFTLVDDLDYTTEDFALLDFEGNGNDFYVFTGFSLVYTFGRPPCYAPIE